MPDGFRKNFRDRVEMRLIRAGCQHRLVRPAEDFCNGRNFGGKFALAKDRLRPPAALRAVEIHPHKIRIHL